MLLAPAQFSLVGEYFDLGIHSFPLFAHHELSDAQYAQCPYIAHVVSLGRACYCCTRLLVQKSAPQATNTGPSNNQVSLQWVLGTGWGGEGQEDGGGGGGGGREREDHGLAKIFGRQQGHTLLCRAWAEGCSASGQFCCGGVWLCMT